MIPMLYQDRIIPIEWIYCPRIIATWLQRAEPLADLRLQRSLELVGQLHNVLVVPTGETRYALLAGRRRYEAARALGWEFISVKIISGHPSQFRLSAIFLAENLHRVHLLPEALGFGVDVEEATLRLLALENRRDADPDKPRERLDWELEAARERVEQARAALAAARTQEGLGGPGAGDQGTRIEADLHEAESRLARQQSLCYIQSRRDEMEEGIDDDLS